MGEKKSLYKRRMVKYLYFSRSLSCTDLSILIDRSLANTTKMLNELIAEGMVVETGYAPSSGGRRPLTYSLRSDVMYIVSVAMDQLITRIGIIDMHNRNMVAVETFELDLQQDPQAMGKLSDIISDVIQKSAIPLTKFAGIGIGMPGFIDIIKGVNYSFPQQDEGSVASMIAARTGLPVFLDNDSSVIALAELRSGSRVKHKNTMVVNISWGVGLGLILNGELFRGANGFAGEFSHIPLFNENKLCSCGKHGCLETEASMLVVTEKARKEQKEGRISNIKDLSSITVEEASEAIIQAAIKGDRFAIELISEAGYKIGKALAILIHILNPERIILSGRGASAGKIWLAPIQQAINEHCIPRLAANTTIEMSELGYNAELEGAAALVMENFDKVNKNFLPVKSVQLT